MLDFEVQFEFVFLFS